MDNGGIWPGDESYFQNIRETALQDTIEQLTKELAEARAEIKRLKEWEYCMKTQAPYEAAGATWELRHKHDQAVIAERDKLIEQMREALIVADSLVTSLIDTHVDRCASIYDFDRDIIKAALSATERGEG
jgi:hypothetical protein